MKTKTTERRIRIANRIFLFKKIITILIAIFNIIMIGYSYFCNLNWIIIAALIMYLIGVIYIYLTFKKPNYYGR